MHKKFFFSPKILFVFERDRGTARVSRGRESQEEGETDHLLSEEPDAGLLRS